MLTRGRLDPSRAANHRIEPWHARSRRFRTSPIIPALEREVLDRWEHERTFERLRELNEGKPPFSFVDGPITANNAMGVHHAWGRTLKDVFQRYQALRGHELRYQNGFDCQGLWVEVEVEKSLGLNSKRDIEEYGLAEFSARCRERVAEFAEVITEQSSGSGCGWTGTTTTTPSRDTNIEYIWRFLKEVHRRGWLFKGHRSTQWCPRCGTSLSQHEQAGEGNYEELDHPSLYVRFPLKERDGESLVVWTTTPWTLPANVAAAVKPDARLRAARTASGALAEAGGDYDRVVQRRGARRARVRRARSTSSPAQEPSAHRVIPWDEVELDEGTGIVHIAPGAGTEDFELGRVHGLPVIAPIDEDGRFYPGLRPVRGDVDRRGRGADRRRAARQGPARRGRPDHPPLPDLLALPDAARLPRRRRLVHRRRRDPASSCSPRTRRSSGRRRNTGSGWTTGCATWATGTSRASATSACRCPSTPARAER